MDCTGTMCRRKGLAKVTFGNYCIAGNFRRVQFSWIGNLLTFPDSNFSDACYHANTCIYKRAYFTGLVFAVHESTMKTVKIGPLETSCSTVKHRNGE